MRRLLPAAFLFASAVPAQSQQLARRVGSVGSGPAHFSFAARPDVCGDGRTVILRWLESNTEMFIVTSDGGTITGRYDMRNQVCTHGPVRVQLTVLGGQVRSLWPEVGAGGGGRGRDLGTVATREAADYLLQLARTANEDLSSRAILAAALADSVRITQPLMAMAEDRRLDPANREQAVKWVGRTAARDGDAGADARVRALAADETEDSGVRERAIRVVAKPAGDAFLRDLYRRLTLIQLKERVIRVLGESPSASTLDWIERVARDAEESTQLRERAIRVIGEDRHDTRRLRSLYRDLGPVELKERVIRVVGETGDADAIAWLKSVAVDRAEPHPVRERAVRVLGEQTETAYLREVYDRLGDTELQERVLRALGEAGGAENLRFVRRVALDSTAGSDVRDRALRVTAEAGVATADLVTLYDAIRDPDLRDRLIKLLAERGDRDARAKLADIAQNDPDPDLRQRARRRH